MYTGDLLRSSLTRRLLASRRSLGGAVAFHLAAYCESKNINLAGVIVENTFLSIAKMVDTLMPLVAPLKPLVLRIGWDSEKVSCGAFSVHR